MCYVCERHQLWCSVTELLHADQQTRTWQFRKKDEVRCIQLTLVREANTGGQNVLALMDVIAATGLSVYYDHQNLKV